MLTLMKNVLLSLSEGELHQFYMLSSSTLFVM